MNDILRRDERNLYIFNTSLVIVSCIIFKNTVDFFRQILVSIDKFLINVLRNGSSNLLDNRIIEVLVRKLTSRITRLQSTKRRRECKLLYIQRSISFNVVVSQAIILNIQRNNICSFKMLNYATSNLVLISLISVDKTIYCRRICLIHGLQYFCIVWNGFIHFRFIDRHQRCLTHDVTCIVFLNNSFIKNTALIQTNVETILIAISSRSSIINITFFIKCI